MEWSSKEVLVVGLGVSGLAAARFLAQRGARVTVNDIREEAALGDLPAEAKAMGARCVLGEHPHALFEESSAIVLSPGVPRIDAVRAALDRGVDVMSEVDLAARHLTAPIVAITGTNGKSTVTSLIGEMCAAERPTFVGGNLGTPLIDAVDSDADVPAGVVVAELSSFQLEYVRVLRARVAVLLNVTDDHLDRYDSFEHYAATKAEIFARQSSDDLAVVPADDALIAELVPDAPRRRTFGEGKGDMQVVGTTLVDATSRWSVKVQAPGLRGSHNLQNACAATLVARELGVSDDAISRTLQRFSGLPHRMQFIEQVAGVEFFDDSKATNVGAAVAAMHGLSGIQGRIVLIAGGRDKGGSYVPLRQCMEPNGRAVVLIGEAANLIEEVFRGSSVQTVRAASMHEAVQKSASLASPGDVVLLAPACSSFDMFSSYQARGKSFQHEVRALGGATC